MKQILQNLKTGETRLADVPCPQVGQGKVLIRTTRSLVSSGTERMMVEFGRGNLIAKARQQPDKVRQAVDKMRTDGVVPTIEAVRSKLDQPIALGYCNVGYVLETGEGIDSLAPEYRVVSNGHHAEIVSVPGNLCARVPDGVSDDEAAFTVLGAIALQGIRLVEPSLGECVVVTGLGLVGLLAVQLLKAQGCRVLGIDHDVERLSIANGFGAETIRLTTTDNLVAAANSFSRGNGVDAVIIAASTKSSEPVHQAARMCRKRGRIVQVGITGLELSRTDFYEKELTFQVSCSYGPGRYDPAYEGQGHDYPIGFVRWTEQRNFQAVLDLMADRRIDVSSLISHRFSIDEADRAYELLAGSEQSLGILLTYTSRENRSEGTLRCQRVSVSADISASHPVCLSFIGAGSYAHSRLIPAFKAAGIRLKTVASNGGVSGVHAARKFGFEDATTDTHAILVDTEVNAVVIATRHDSHAQLSSDSLLAGKHVFVEKPLALTLEELASVQRAMTASQAESGTPLLMVGFNRRFAPHVRKLKELLKSKPGPKSFVMTVNAGAVPAEHWTQSRHEGGGRIVGEACHFIDLLRHLAGSEIDDAGAHRMDAPTADTVSIDLGFTDGSIGTIHYFANGNRSVPKERLEVFAGGSILQLDNFRTLTGHGWPGFRRMHLWRQDKGQAACAFAFVQAVERGGAPPIPLDEIIEVSKVAINLAGTVR